MVGAAIGVSSISPIQDQKQALCASAFCCTLQGSLFFNISCGVREEIPGICVAWKPVQI